MRIEARIAGLERLQAGVAAAPATVVRETRAAMTAGCLLVEGTARDLAPRDTGRLSGSITHSIGGGGADLTGRIGPAVAYGIVIERGRRPGAKPPPVGALRPWALRRGIPEGALFVIARAIGRRGLKARPFLAPALERHRAGIVERFARVGLRVVARMAG